MLRYIGGGFLPGIPARDLSDAEVEELEKMVEFIGSLREHLCATGLYSESKALSGGGEDKLLRPERENKRKE